MLRNYKLLLLIPAMLFLLSVGMILTNGINRDIDLTGGVAVTLKSGKSAQQIAQLFSSHGFEVKEVKEIKPGIYQVVLKGENTENLERVNAEVMEIRKFSPVLASGVQAQMIGALIIAFALMSVVVFLIFRSPLPSFYVLFAVAADMVEALAFSQALGIALSIPVISALLLLIGYSADTDILLTTRVLKGREGEVRERIFGACKTGLTMSLTTLGAILPVIFISSSKTLVTIGTVLFLGIVCDVINTWFGNAVMLRWWVEKNGKG